MKKNLTLSIDKEVLKEARKQALERGTSVNQMVREYLQEISGMEEQKKQAMSHLKKMWKESEGEIGEITWTREELHDR